MLASSFGDPVLGLDIHFELVPMPAPTPTPIPNPFTGVVFDPVGLAVGLAISNAVGAVFGAPLQGPVVYWTAFPATNTGTEAKHVPGHIMLPPGTGWAPFPKTPKPVIRPGETPDPPKPVSPENDAVVIFGSKTVTVGGSNAVRLGDIALSCAEPVRLPSSVVLAVPKGAPILIGGPPSLDIMAAILASLRTRFVSDSLHAALSRLRPSRFRNFMHRAVCFFTGHPVDVASGKVLATFVDAELPGPLPLKVERIYSSAFASRKGALGHGWSSSLHQSVWEERGKVVLLAEDGREIEFDTFDEPRHRLPVGGKVYNAIERLTLHRTGDARWEVADARGVVRTFEEVAGQCRQPIREIRSRCGFHTIAFDYDRLGRLRSVVDSGGRVIEVDHDASGRLSELRLPDPAGPGSCIQRRYRYDVCGDLVEVVDAKGDAWRFEYEGHLLTRETNRVGFSYYFQYDGLGEDAWCVRTWGDDSIRDHVLTYDKKGRKTAVTDSLGNTTTFEMNVAGLVESIVNPVGGETRIEYDPQTLREVKRTEPGGATTVRTYDGRGNCVAIEDGAGARREFRFDHNNQPIEAVDPLGGRWWWRYDGRGRLLERGDPAGATCRFEYDRGLLRRVTSPTGVTTQLNYDRHRQLVRAAVSGRGKVEVSYDRQGRRTRFLNLLGSTERHAYDAGGRLCQIVDTTGVARKIRYDAEDNPIAEDSPLHRVRYGYTSHGRLAVRRQGDTEVRFDYDTEERLIAVHNEGGETYSVERDELGRVAEELDFAGASRRLIRDPAGRVVTEVHGDESVVDISRDSLGRVVSVDYGAGEFERFEYRADGALQLAANQDATVFFERDVLGRLTEERTEIADDPDASRWVRSRYAPAGSRIGVSSSEGLSEAFAFDDHGDTVGIEAAVASSANPGASTTWSAKITRSANGREWWRETADGLVCVWDHDEAGRPTEQRVGTKTQTLGSTQYSWGPGYRLESMTCSDWGGVVRYRHDAHGRLVEVTYPTGRVETRAFDVSGNVFPATDGSRRYDCGRLERDGPKRYEYDRRGRLSACTSGTDPPTRYQWNRGGRLGVVELPTGASVRFSYDAFGRRLSKRVCLPGQDDAEEVTTWTWDRDVLVHERRGGDLRSWVYDPLSFRVAAQVSNGQAFSAVTDHLGTPTALVDASGGVVWRMRLHGLGDALVESRDGVQCPLRWPGQYADSETGLYYNRFRYYDPSAGRYISPDPLGLAGGLSMYSYVDDPLVAFDPLGLISDVALGLSRNPRTGENILHPFAESVGGSHNGNWIPDGLSNEAPFVQRFYQAMYRSTSTNHRVHFNLDHLDLNQALDVPRFSDPFDVGVTNWELQQILNNRMLHDATDFYIGGEKIPRSELDEWGLSCRA